MRRIYFIAIVKRDDLLRYQDKQSGSKGRRFNHQMYDNRRKLFLYGKEPMYDNEKNVYFIGMVNSNCC
ncbi:MAG: hypothetical protein NUV76_05810, partial [Candidatus Kuenenia sp.]|nr:hypothetical protein [Candidatus Kuenenia sp.]